MSAPPWHLSLRSFYLNTLGHNVRPPNTLLPGQANITQAQYEDLSIALLTELWTQFGPLQEIWLDGGCGRRVRADTGRRRVYATGQAS